MGNQNSGIAFAYCASESVNELSVAPLCEGVQLATAQFRKNFRRQQWICRRNGSDREAWFTLRKEETERRRIRMIEILWILGVLSSQFDGLLSWKFVTTGNRWHPIGALSSSSFLRHLSSAPSLSTIETMTSLSKPVYTGDGEDRISSLPEALLLHILSLMPTQYAVRTSILSLKWKDLWTFVPSLHFGEWMSSKTVDDNDLRFVNFVDHVLLHHKLCSIERVSFYVRGHHSDVVASRLHEWIRAAIRRHVRVINIQMCPIQPLSLPLELFTCKTLIKLQLSRELEFDTILSSVWLPNLRDLWVSLHYPGNDITQKLFSSCPMLEELYIRANVDNEEDMVLNVCAPALKRLEFQLVAYLHNEHLERGMMLSRNKIVVNAPVLEDLIVYDDYLACYSLENLSSLVSAYIDVGHCCIQVIGMKEHANQIFKLLEGITSVKFLTLHEATMGVLDFADDTKLPLFPNLIRLNLVVPDDYSWRLLPDFLCSAPNLATLVLCKTFGEGDLINEFSWVEPHKMPTCLLSNLEKLVVIRFDGVDSELKLLKYFLENGRVLKKVLIGCSHLTLEEKSNFLETVVQFQKVSKTCQIEHSDSPIYVSL